MNNETILLPDEKLEPLGNNMKIVVSSDHTFGTDAVLLASFASPKRKDKALDMGTGCGIIPLIWCKGETKDITAIDIQEKAVKQCEKSIELNKTLYAKCKDITNKIANSCFLSDLVDFIYQRKK